MKKKLLIIISILILCACSKGQQTTYVTRGIDGDTIEVSIKNKAERVRLIGVDTPETVHPDKEIEPGGLEAAAFTKYILEGKTVVLEFDQLNDKINHRDKYNRLLAYVYLIDGEDSICFNAELIRLGYSKAYTRYPFEYMSQFMYLEEQN